MEAMHMNRLAASDFYYTKPYVFISITDPEKLDADISPCYNMLGVLRLKFHDLDREYPGWGAKLMTSEQAEQVVEFVKKYPLAELVAVHCEAGICRSAGMAAAIVKAFGGDDSQFYRTGQPNALVYRLVLEAFYKKEV